MFPTRIWLSFKSKTTSVRTIGLELVDDLAGAVKNQYLHSLRDIDKADITLHTTEQAEALTLDSHLEEIGAQLSPCGSRDTPLIVKVISNVAPETPLTKNGIPKIIWLSFKGKLTSVQTKELELIDHLAKVARNEFPGSLCGICSSDITLHLTEQAEAMALDLRLEEIAAQLSPCGSMETPLIVRCEILS
ncbi:uncharacterized protein PGTG_15185 [Puccinia graminis f. sp. tritici CRL 75-36-700-3]|uniref:Uncharacterized protein n=1 Tax=Puccinia graminis f. sp. tritici (strain CRL 75-36-700-3 / race SCCL) TaxID=418459 RepID=E3KXA9_PUCGT|nr:uncharacterized protein PGTG_15185 [Puccinia graminis f. sp. tritici CRL 75-36-700-3]EFP88982.2 hypothetical protein PGTG_15185 [Puccinia graminis f. sp. tritici CRL 75-36-700-3]